MTNKQITYDNERIRTGQSFMYREKGIESMVLEIHLTEAIEFGLLDEALQKTLKRYRYFTQKFVEIKGDFYLVPNDKPCILRNEKRLLPLGGQEVNNYLVDLNYLNSTLWISYHHGLCDGKGIMPFLRTLLFYYLSTKYTNTPIHKEMFFISPISLKEETKEPGLVSLKTTKKDLTLAFNNEGYRLPETKQLTTRKASSYHYQVAIKASSFIKYCKTIGATPAIGLSLLVSNAIDNTRENILKPIVCNLVVDLRNGVDLENTHRNCVSSLKLLFDSSKTLKEQAIDARKKINHFKSTENLQMQIGKINQLSDQLDQLDSFEKKQKVVSFFDTLQSDTYILSYIGQLNLGNYEQYIQEIHTYSSGTPGLSIEVLATDQTFFLDIMQEFEHSIYVDEFLKLLKESNIVGKLTKQDLISTPYSNV